ncbi:hypothetical protein JN11_03939 [Mucilaginibacter frigoritolerans]|uniref:Uncharacterized protein n=1 Tax=Mucilaginibacter frigoritolerans TaxID=652788 RepID=A0A562TUP2_9SPHI|nr:hypothetical protein [Mucilaginibacter frigoritolerans]TWI96826.1 hypothetical protein JN11_03939 [Mucilaginibacter frigoritolerans]
MRKAWWITISIIYSIFLLVIGVLLGKTIQRWPILKVKTEVDTVGAMVSLISIGATLGVAYWVASILESKKENNRVEKDLIIRRIDAVYALIEETKNNVAAQAIDFTLAVSNIKRISVNIIAVIEAVKKTKITLEDLHKANIVTAISTLKDLLTNTPPIKEEHLADLPIDVREGIIHMSTERKLQIDAEFDKIKWLIFDLELAINKG